MFALVVTVHVQLSVPEFTVTHLLSYFLTIHCVASDTFSGWSQSIGCALAWVTTARYPESEHNSILRGNSTGFMQVTNFLPSYRWGDYVAIVF